MSANNSTNYHHSLVDLMSLLLDSITFDQNIQEAQMHQQNFEFLEISHAKAQLRTFLQNDPYKHQHGKSDIDTLRLTFKKLNGALERLKNKTVPFFSQNEINEMLMNSIKCQNKLLNIENEKLSRQNDEKNLIKQIHDLLIKQIGRLLSDLMIYSQRQERYRQIQFERDCLLKERYKYKEQLAQKDRQMENQKAYIAELKQQRAYSISRIMNKQEDILERLVQSGRNIEDSLTLITEVQNTLVSYPDRRKSLKLIQIKSYTERNSAERNSAERNSAEEYEGITQL